MRNFKVLRRSSKQLCFSKCHNGLVQPRAIFRAILIHCLLLTALGCRAKVDESRASRNTSERQPTASEIFHLRSECASLTDRIYRDQLGMLEPTRDVKSYYWWHAVSQRSHYDPEVNRCFAEITTRTTDRANSGYEAWSTEFYDGQTKELLAMTRHQVSSGSLPKEQDTGHILGTVPAEYEDNFRGASEYIRQAMEDHRTLR